MRRAFTVVLLVVEALFFNVVIPGHTRGMIQLGGTRSASCCAGKQGNPKEIPADKNGASHCAVCAFAAQMSVPPGIDFAPAPIGLAEILPVSKAQQVDSVTSVRTYLGRAPPC